MIHRRSTMLSCISIIVSMTALQPKNTDSGVCASMIFDEKAEQSKIMLWSVNGRIEFSLNTGSLAVIEFITLLVETIDTGFGLHGKILRSVKKSHICISRWTKLWAIRRRLNTQKSEVRLVVVAHRCIWTMAQDLLCSQTCGSPIAILAIKSTKLTRSRRMVRNTCW